MRRPTLGQLRLSFKKIYFDFVWTFLSASIEILWNFDQFVNMNLFLHIFCQCMLQMEINKHMRRRNTQWTSHLPKKYFLGKNYHLENFCRFENLGLPWHVPDFEEFFFVDSKLGRPRDVPVFKAAKLAEVGLWKTKSSLQMGTFEDGHGEFFFPLNFVKAVDFCLDSSPKKVPLTLLIFFAPKIVLTRRLSPTHHILVPVSPYSPKSYSTRGLHAGRLQFSYPMVSPKKCACTVE